MDYIMQSLKSLSLFADLSEDSLHQLAHKLEEQTLPAGHVLFHRGDLGDSLYLVRNGRVKVYVENLHGEELVLNQFGAGESFGEMAIVDQRPRSASAKTLEPSTLLKLEREGRARQARTGRRGPRSSGRCCRAEGRRGAVSQRSADVPRRASPLLPTCSSPAVSPAP